MGLPYYAFSAEFGSFAIEAKYAKELGKYLFYDEVKDIFLDKDGNIQLDVLECNPLVASGTYLYNSVFGSTGYLNHMPLNGSMDPYETIPVEKIKYGPVEIYSKDSNVNGRASICYELPGEFAADIISFSMFGTDSNGMFLHIDTTSNVDPTNIGLVGLSMIDSDDYFGDSYGNEDADIALLIKKIRESK